jgi:hypothetical protein
MIWAPRYPPRPAVGRTCAENDMCRLLFLSLFGFAGRYRKTAKRFFRVIAKGVAVVNRAHRALESMTEGLGFIRSYS